MNIFIGGIIFFFGVMCGVVCVSGLKNKSEEAEGYVFAGALLLLALSVLLANATDNWHDYQKICIQSGYNHAYTAHDTTYCLKYELDDPQIMVLRTDED